MPRITIGVWWWGCAALLVDVSTVLAAADPHLDRSLLKTGCPACHEGHGVAGSPMLPVTQAELCLACHDSKSKASAQIRKGVLSPDARPPSLSLALEQPFTHPVDLEAYSRFEEESVTCTSCHSPHRRSTRKMARGPKLSTRNPNQFEYELCNSCHGTMWRTGGGTAIESVSLRSGSNSYHPIAAPSETYSPSVTQQISGRLINCTDCHGNSDAAGSRGPHGSAVQHILKQPYSHQDGTEESPTTYSLCYGCHDRDLVLGSSTFPLHRRHVIDLRTSCSTCHNPHSSYGNRALIRFGEDTTVREVAASALTGRLAYLSNGPGTGSCHLTCHGYDHAPETYGGYLDSRPETLTVGIETLTSKPGETELVADPALGPPRPGPRSDRIPPKKE